MHLHESVKGYKASVPKASSSSPLPAGVLQSHGV